VESAAVGFQHSPYSLTACRIPAVPWHPLCLVHFWNTKYPPLACAPSPGVSHHAAINMNAAAISNTRGFEGVIHGATLADLVQMECLAMTTRAVRVDRGDTFGRIFFAGGKVVHAEMGELRGEVALFALISWPNGSFTIEDGVRSMEETIGRDWHSLLIEAAQMADEAHAATGTILRSNSSAAPPMQKFNPALVRDVVTDPDIVGGIQFSEEGSLLEVAADNPEDLQATFSYVLQLTRLIGESLGAENLREIQISGADFKALCSIKGDETVAAIGNPKANVAALLKKIA
jgi:hypothetical protein